jgi:tight adherence protein B
MTNDEHDAMMHFLPELILLGAPVTLVAAAFLLLRQAMQRRQREREERWQTPEGADELTLAERVAASRPPEDWRGEMDHGFALMVQRSGLPLSAGQAGVLVACAGLIPAGLLMLWRGSWWLALAGLLAGSGLFLAVLWLRQGRWRRRAQDQLPDALFLLARSLRAGLSLEEALATVGEHGLPPLAGEFERCVGHLQLGLTVSAALQLMAARLGLQDFNGLVALVTMHRTTGGNLPALLDRWAASTRDRNQFRGYFRAATALARISATALASAVPIVLLGYWLFRPEWLERFARSSMGFTTMTVAGILEVVGTLWAFSLTRIDY